MCPKQSLCTAPHRRSCTLPFSVKTQQHTHTHAHTTPRIFNEQDMIRHDLRKHNASLTTFLRMLGQTADDPGVRPKPCMWSLQCFTAKWPGTASSRRASGCKGLVFVSFLLDAPDHNTSVGKPSLATVALWQFIGRRFYTYWIDRQI